MTADIYLWRLTPGQAGGRRHVAMLTIRDLDYNGASVQGDHCLNIDVSLTPGDPIKMGTRNGERAVTLTWLSLAAEIWTTQIPRQRLGRIVIDAQGMPGLSGVHRPSSPWHWLVSARDVELVEQLRTAQPDSPLQLAVEVEGLVKMTFGEPAQLVDIINLYGESTGNLVVEMPKWDRMMKSLGFAVKTPALGLADRISVEHPSWRDAMQVTERAQSHYRSGEDYDALRDCLAGLEALVSSPYQASSWRPLLQSLPGQKAEGIAQLLAGMATYCNKIGHHRDRERRDTGGSLPAQPLDHWETDLIIGAAHYLLAYAMRLRQVGQLTIPTPPSPVNSREDAAAAAQTADDRATETPGGEIPSRASAADQDH